MATFSSRDDPLPFEEVCRSLPDRCVGHARTMGRRCRNPIGMHKYPEANRLIARISSTNDRPSILNLLHRVAEILLCSRWHQDQAEVTARAWLKDIEQSPLTTRTTSQTSTSMTSTSTSQSVDAAVTSTMHSSREIANALVSLSAIRQNYSTLANELTVANNTIEELRQQVAEYNNLKEQMSSLRRRFRSAIQDNEILREQTNEIDKLRDTGTLLRAQIVDLSDALDDTRTELTTARDETSQLSLSLESEREGRRALQSEKINLQLRYEEERKARLDAEAKKDDLQKKLHSETEAKIMIEREKYEVGEVLLSERELRSSTDNHNTELKERISDLECRLLKQERDEEARTMEIEARRVRWDKYNADWIRFNAILGPSKGKPRCCRKIRKSLLTCLQEQDNTQDDIREQIPWPTESRDMADTCADNVRIFLLNHIPGLVGIANPDTLTTAVSHLEYEVSKWHALCLRLPPLRMAYDETTGDLLYGILGTVCEVLMDTQRQLRAQMDAPLDAATTQSNV